MKTISIIVSGKVQGVFYRQSTREKALALGISGEVRNLEDGTVSIIATGDEGQLSKLVDWCKQGPPKALVSGLDIKVIPFREFGSFTIVRG